MQRRTFLKTLASATAALSIPQTSFGANGEADRLGSVLPKRLLGRTGEHVTMLGVGGWHIGGKMSEVEAQAVIETAIEGGVRFFDTAESYQKGESERRYGTLLTPKYRDDVFLMTKSTAKDAKTAQAHLEGSLCRLKTDHLDLWQMHTVQDPADVDRRIAQGVIDLMVKAKESGKVRHIGFTGHKRTSAHQHVFEKTDVFETCQLPINCADPAYDSFVERVMPTLVEKNYGVLAMKTLSNGNFFGRSQKGEMIPALIPDRISIREALHFVWSLPVSVLITGPDDRVQMQEKIDLARSFQKLSEEGRQALITNVAEAAGKTLEYYKA